MIKLVIVAPAFDEAAVLPDFIQAVLSLRRELSGTIDVRLLVVDDGSTDGTADVLRRAADAHPDVIAYLSLTANAGHQAALIAGLCHAGSWSDVIVTMDADLEHPMPVVGELVESWRQTGAIVVHAIRRPTRELPLLKRLPSAMFYRVTAALTGLRLSTGQADFRLWDAAVLRSVAHYLPHVGSLRVFAAWLPGPKASVSYEQHVRNDRTSRFTFRKNYELAAISIVRFSHFPLQVISALGLVGLIFSISYGAFIALETARGNTIPGWSSTVLTVMTMGCLQLLAFGVLANYLRRLVFARDLPPWVVRASRLTPLAASSESRSMPPTDDARRQS
jgi:glycosyltransferase involved in cell wall biosynthesis